MKKILGAAVVALAIAAGSAPAIAHHNANAQWLTEKDVPLTGVLKELKDISPHAHWLVEVKNSKGGVDVWDLEAVSANLLRRQGIMVKQQIKPGQTYTFFTAPSRDGSKTAFIKAIMLDGKRVDFVRL
jgi:hypothetical protein